MDDSTTKRCRVCGVPKTASEYYQRKDPAHGKENTCKVCVRAIRRAYHAKLLRDAVTRVIPNEKTCARCQEMKPSDAFAHDVSNLDGLFSYCRDCQNARQRESAHGSGRDRRQQAEKRYYQRDKRQRNEYALAYRQAHRNDYNARACGYRAANPERVQHTNRQTRARRKGATGTYTRREWRALCAWFGNVCLRCGSDGALSVDHVVPIILGGSNYIDNLQPLCRSCNSSKHTKHIDYRDPERLAAFLASLG
jgi:5-methylcytosine-specific restriction endonuclease McrA